MKKGTEVTLIKIDNQEMEGLNIGQKGIVIATRFLPCDSEPQCLIKWKGRLGHCAHNQSEVREG